MNRLLRRTTRIAIFVGQALALAATGLAADPAPPSESPVLMTPVTVYGGDYRVLPGAASVNVLTSEPVQGGALASTRDLTALAPNFAVLDGNNNRMPRFSIRGLRENNFVTGDPAVGLYLDDVPCADLYSRSLALQNVESIEFIRGPQGTLYGASGPGGVLNITSHQPGDAWHGSAGFSYGSHDQQAYDATLSGPVVSKQLALGVSGLYSTRDGFVRNTFDGSRPDDQQTLTGRVQLHWTPSEPWEVSLLASGQRFNDGLVPTFNPASDSGLFAIARDFNGHVDTETWNVALKAAWRGETVRATSVTSFRSWRQDLAQDFDFGTNAVGATVGLFQPHVEQWTEELRLRSLDDSALKWNAGFYFATVNTDTASGRTVDLVPPYVVDSSMTHAKLEARTYAAFGEATYTVREKLDFIAGVRLTYDEREMQRNRSGVNFLDPRLPTGPFQTGAFSVDDNFTSVQPKFGLAYHFQPECVLYATVSAGYQSGGFNASNDDPAQSHFDPARSWNYEVGVRTLWLDQKLELNTALFFTDTHDYQVYRLNAYDPAQAWLLNADRATAWGAEVELIARPTKNLTLSLLGGYTHAEFDKFRDPYNGESFAGNTINFVPEFTAAFAAEYRIWKGLYARAEVVGVGKFYLDEANTARQGAYALLNARLGYAGEHFEVFVSGRNLLDQAYASNALDFRPFSGLIRQPGDPLCLGVGLSAKF
jgi:iron complex outermembrane receptor protein